MSPEEMDRILQLAERIEKEDRMEEMDEQDYELYNKTTSKTIH